VEPRQTARPEADTLDALPSTGLLSFYDRLRERVAGSRDSRVRELLLLVPDVFVLLARLSLDPAVPKASRALIGGALAYFVMPLDLLPEGVIGPSGYLEDLVLACAVLAHAFGPELDELAARHWSGAGRLRQVLGDVSRAAEALLGESLYGRVQGLLARRAGGSEG